MGIKGLLRELRDITSKDQHISKYAGMTVAIDGYSWLHKGAYSCAQELVEGLPTDSFVRYFMHRIGMMKHHNITPYVVFDGDRVPGKEDTLRQRHEDRKANIEKGKRLLREAEQAPESQKEDLFREANEYLQRAVPANPEMAAAVISALRKENVPFLVAPYEADAQLAYLVKRGKADVILSEDSDILVYCVAAASSCPVFYKMDAYGNGEELDLRCLRERASGAKGFVKDMIQFMAPECPNGSRLFIQMCIMAGCDYLSSLPGIGLATAQKLLVKYRSVPDGKRVSRILHNSSSKALKLKIPMGYLDKFHQAENLFLYHRVYDPDTKKCVTLNDVNNQKKVEDSQEQRAGKDVERDNKENSSSQSNVTNNPGLKLITINPPVVSQKKKRRNSRTTKLQTQSSSSHSSAGIDSEIDEFSSDGEQGDQSQSMCHTESEACALISDQRIVRESSGFALLGMTFDETTARSIAEGLIHPRSKQPLNAYPAPQHPQRSHSVPFISKGGKLTPSRTAAKMELPRTSLRSQSEPILLRGGTVAQRTETSSLIARLKAQTLAVPSAASKKNAAVSPPNPTSAKDTRYPQSLEDRMESIAADVDVVEIWDSSSSQSLHLEPENELNSLPATSFISLGSIRPTENTERTDDTFGDSKSLQESTPDQKRGSRKVEDSISPISRQTGSKHVKGRTDDRTQSSKAKKQKVAQGRASICYFFSKT